MGIQVVWDTEEKLAVRFIYSGTWTWDEFHDVIRAANTMMDTVSYPVLSIVDMRGSKYMGDNAMHHIRSVIERSADHNNTNVTVFVDSDHMWKAILGLTRQIHKNVERISHFYYVDTLEEARLKVQELHHKLISNSDVA